MPEFNTKEDEEAYLNEPSEEQLWGDQPFPPKKDKRSDYQVRLSTVWWKLKRGDKYCNEDERKSITKLDRRTWWRKRREGTAPNSFKRGGRNYWFESELLSWLGGKKDWKAPEVDSS